MTPGDELRAEAARSDRAARDLRGRLTHDLAPLAREKLEALLAVHVARSQLWDICAEAADRCGS